MNCTSLCRKPRRGRGTKILVLALGLAALATAPALSQGTVCNVSVDVLTVTPKRASDSAVVEFMAVGDIVDVVVELEGGTITGGTNNTVSITEIFINLDNSGGNDVFSWQGIVATTCDGTADFWNCDHAIGDTDPNTVICTADTPVVLDGDDNAGQTPTSCTFTYRKELESIAASNTAVVSQVSGTGISAADATCDNGLTTADVGSGAEKLCPVACSFDDFPGLDPQCNDLICDQFDVDNDDVRECLSDPKDASTTCEADTSLCTLDHCNATGVCVNESVVTCDPPAEPQCESIACNPANGQCESDFQDISFGCETDTDLCSDEHCDGAGDCVVDQSTIVQCDDGLCFTAECNPATGDCDRTCDATLDPGCQVEISNCIWQDEPGDTAACQDPGDGSSTACPGGINGVDVELLNCDDPNNPVSSGNTSTTGGGIYSFTKDSIDANCEPENHFWQIRVEDIGEFVAPNDAGCTDATDSDCVEEVAGTGLTDCREISPGTDDSTIDCGRPPQPPPDCCLLIIDEEGVDNDFQTVEFFANEVHVDGEGEPLFTPGELVNDECHPVFNTCIEPDAPPSETNNWDLVWNLQFPGDEIKLPTGQRDDEGWFMLPPETDEAFQEYLTRIGYEDDYAGFVADFVAGTIPQALLDKVPNVMPLRNQEIESLVDRTCVAVVYDSDINIDFVPLLANLQGERYGLFTFTILAVETPGSLKQSDVPGATSSDPFPNTLQESKSSTSLYDVWLRVEDPLVDPASCAAGLVDIHDHEPDTCAITSAKWVSDNGTGTLTVKATSDFGPQTFEDPAGSFVTLTVDNTDKGGDPDLDPILLEVPMTNVLNSSGNPTKKFTFSQAGLPNLKGRRISVQSNHGCVYNVKVTK